MSHPEKVYLFSLSEPIVNANVAPRLDPAVVQRLISDNKLLFRAARSVIHQRNQKQKVAL